MHTSKFTKDTCSVMQSMASITRATTSERRIAPNARFTDKASVALPADATAALRLIPAVSISLYFCKNKLFLEIPDTEDWDEKVEMKKHERKKPSSIGTF